MFSLNQLIKLETQVFSARTTRINRKDMVVGTATIMFVREETGHM
jgi:hypothetical protein